MRQPNSNDCGVFAAAIATELTHYSDPALCRWDTSKMRQHLLLCLEAGKMTRFPTLGKRQIGIWCSNQEVNCYFVVADYPYTCLSLRVQ